MTSMYKHLRELCGKYIQDFDIFDTDTEPVDMYCGWHEIGDRKQLLAEMRSFLDEVKAGTKSIDDLVRMGLQSLPPPKEGQQFDGNSWEWFVEAMAYLETKIAEG